MITAAVILGRGIMSHNIAPGRSLMPAANYKNGERGTGNVL